MVGGGGFSLSLPGRARGTAGRAEPASRDVPLPLETGNAGAAVLHRKKVLANMSSVTNFPLASKERDVLVRAKGGAACFNSHGRIFQFFFRDKKGGARGWGGRREGRVWARVEEGLGRGGIGVTLE